MAEKQVGAKAIVTLTIEIEAKSHWGSDCSAQQIYDQAKSDVLGQLRNSQHGTDGVTQRNALQFANSVQIVGEPTVRTILVERER